MAVYLDVCALGRPFDNQNQLRIRLETDAVLLILSYIRSGSRTLVVSPVHQIEIIANSNLNQREYLLTLLDEIGFRPNFDLQQGRIRAEHLAKQGMGAADAAHVALAEQIGADFVTCDARLLRQTRRIQPAIWCGTPNAYCERENLE